MISDGGIVISSLMHGSDTGPTQLSHAQFRPVLALMHFSIAAASRGSGLSSSALAGSAARRQRTTVAIPLRFTAYPTSAHAAD
jgi:hypothetical protein